MKDNYDIIVVGSGTAGLLFARNTARAGFKVLVIDSNSIEKAGEKLGILHCDMVKFKEFDLPEPKPGDPEYITEWNPGTYYSPYSQYMKRNEVDAKGKPTQCIVRADYPFLVGKLPPMIVRYRKLCEDLGVEFVYDAAFVDFVLNADGKPAGAQIKIGDEIISVSARLVADCSGVASAARLKLPKTTKVSQHVFTPDDFFYVYAKIIKIKNPEDYTKTCEHWAFYKSWLGMGTAPDESVLGTGANISYEYAEICHDRFTKNIQIPEHEVTGMLKGVTPFCPSPYSMVDDGFVCMGDTASMTKWVGEGICAGWVGTRIMANTVIEAMKDGAYPTEDKLWAANVKYNTTQAADFAYIVATTTNAVDCSADEMEYEFRKGIVFNDKAMTRLNSTYTADMPLGEVLQLVGKVLVGVITGKISFKTVKLLLRGILYAGKLKSHYRKFPTTNEPVAFKKWADKADALWKATGTIAAVTRAADKEGVIAAEKLKAERNSAK
jgi:flavin-dependent dehydrogenase